jgi:K+-sensing histidine kinase KdpD
MAAIATRYGWPAGGVSAALSVTAYNYFFIPPVFAFAAHRPQLLLTEPGIGYRLRDVPPLHDAG